MFIVEKIEDPEGKLILSRRRADFNAYLGRHPQIKRKPKSHTGTNFKTYKRRHGSRFIGN